MSVKNLYVILALLLFISCTSADEQNYLLFEDFGDAVTLTGERVFEEEYAAFYMSGVDSLIVFSTPMRDHIFQVHSTNNTFLGSFGVIGNGPAEFSDAAIKTQLLSKNGSPMVFIYDNTRLSYYLIDVMASLEKGETVLAIQQETPSELVSSLEILYAGNNQISGIYDDVRFQNHNGQINWFVHNFEQDSMRIAETFNVEVNPPEPMGISNLNMRMPAIAPDFSKIAAPMVWLPRLEIFDTQSFSEENYLFTREEIPAVYEMDDFMSDKLEVQFIHSTATNDRVYLLYMGQSTANFQPTEKQVFVLDWNGNPQCRLLLPEEYNVEIIHADESTGHLYGHSYSIDETHRFDLSAAGCL